MNFSKLLGTLLFISLYLTACTNNFQPHPLDVSEPVKGWMILSDNEEEGLYVIENAARFDINHIQISHHVIHSLRHVREDDRRNLSNKLTKAAHDAGIQEVVLWDRALHELDYYPEQFRTGPEGTIDFDNPDFWQWFQDDYREMLDLVPDIQGLILTFIETGARAENQHSEVLTTNQQKLAAVVNAVAEVVIGERRLNLYARTFSYTHEEYDNIVGAVDLFEWPEIRLMMKETPHDFFLTHPNDFFAGTMDRPTLMEFDTGAEFNGQGVIMNTWPEYVLSRWSDFLERDNIIGYVARTDRYGDTRIVGRPSEINLLALKRYFEEPTITADDLYREFITEHYGEDAREYVQQAFENSFDYVTSVFYTLGINSTDHSRLDYDPYPSHWARHVSGKWIDPPYAFVEHDVNQRFHYWTDVVNTLAPVWAKKGGTQLDEVPWVIENGWLDQHDNMNEEYLGYIITEKEYGIKLAEESLNHIIQARGFLSDEDYEDLYQYFERSVLTARIHRHVAAAYFGFRVYARGEEFRTTTLMDTVRDALIQIPQIAGEIENYPHHVPAGQWDWRNDAQNAMRYYHIITETGWPEETGGYENPYAGQTFPL